MAVSAAEISAMDNILRQWITGFGAHIGNGQMVVLFEGFHRRDRGEHMEAIAQISYSMRNGAMMSARASSARESRIRREL